MAIPKNNIRGLQDINTFTGRVDKLHEAYKKFQRIGVLEMEKVRRSKERESAFFRVKVIDDRFREIETEKEVLIKNLGFEQSAEEEHSKEPDSEPKQGKDSNKEGFTIKY